MALIRSRRLSHKLLAAALMGFTALSAPAVAETLEEALARAYETNPTLQAARASLRAVDEGVPQALSRWRPVVEASADISRVQSYNNSRQAGTTRYTTPRGAELNIVQPLYDPTASAATDRAEKEVLAERARLTSAEQEVMLSVVTAYSNMLRDQAVLELNINNEQRLRRQYDAANDRFRVGEITRTDVAQAEARLARATADRILAEGNVAASRAVYRNVVGTPPTNLVVPQIPANLPAGQEEATVLAASRFPDVVAADYTSQAALDNVRTIEGELLPEVNLRGTLAADEGSSPEVKANSASITAEVVVPLYTGGSVASRIRAAKQIAAQRRQQLDEARRDVMEASTRAWESLETSRASIRALDSEIEASQIALEGVEKEALVGSRTVLDVLDAEQELLNAKVNLVQARRDAIVAAYELKATIGTLTAREMGLPVSYYDERSYYENVRGKWWGTRIEGE